MDAKHNIVDDLKWTTVTSKAYRKTAPRIYAQAYKVTKNAILDAADSFTNAGGAGGIRYYDRLHTAEKEGKLWSFPFFTDQVRGFTNSWGDTYVGSTNGSQSIGTELLKNVAEVGGAIDSTIAQANAALEGKPGALFEPPKFYSYGVSDSDAALEFTLINTDEEEDWRDNYDTIKELIKINRFSRTDGFVAKPPVLWDITIPGYRRIRWASCGVTISLLGRRELREEIIVPEGYRVALNFTSLYTEPMEFMEQFK